MLVSVGDRVGVEVEQGDEGVGDGVRVAVGNRLGVGVKLGIDVGVEVGVEVIVGVGTVSSLRP